MSSRPNISASTLAQSRSSIRSGSSAGSSDNRRVVPRRGATPRCSRSAGHSVNGPNCTFTTSSLTGRLLEMFHPSPSRYSSSYYAIRSTRIILCISSRQPTIFNRVVALERTPGPEVMENMTATEVLSETRHASGAFEDFYREHRPRMIGLSYVLTGARDVVDEIVHDAFVSVYPKWCAATCAIRVAYLKQTVVNRATRGGHGSAWSERGSSNWTRISIAHGRPRRRCSRMRQRYAPRLAAMRRLPPNQRITIALRYFEDLPIDEIARLMGGAHECFPAATVRSWIRRALRTMAQGEGGAGIRAGLT